MGNSKILIVDDDPDLRQALRLRLRANDYDTVHAVDGYSAIALAYKERPNLIILDLGLPAGDGFVVLDRLPVRACDHDQGRCLHDRWERQLWVFGGWRAGQQRRTR